jgi:hypothetical protein
MSQSIILKRSAVSGKVPTTSSLAIGELAINTYDGKIFLNQSGSTQAIQEVIITNATNTGSINLIGNQNITGSLGVSGNITVLGSVNARQFNIGIISSSVIYQSGSSKFGDTGDDVMQVTGSIQISGSQTITGSVGIVGGLTASLQQGYTWVGNANNTTVLVATSSFGGVGGSTDISSLNTFTASTIPRLTNLETTTASLNISISNLNIYSASVSNSIQQLSSKTGSYATTGSNTFIGNETISGSLIVNGITTLSGSLSLSPSQSAFLVSHSISQSTTVGSTVYGVNITPLFTNVTSSQTQTALRVMPTFTGRFSGSNTTNIIADFGAASVGSQFTINDVVSGSIYMVNDVSGLPIIEALSDGQVNMYDFPYKAFNKSGSYLSLGTSLTPSSSVTIQSDFIVNKGYGLYSRTTQASGSTVSNVTSSLFNLVFSNTSSSVFMSAVVTGYDTGSRQTVTGDIKSTIKYNAGIASVVGYNQKFINSEVANVNFDIVASSVSASLLVYGSGSTTYKWGATITYQVI